LYHYRPTEEFERKLKKLARSDSGAHARVLKAIERLLQVPDESDGKMHGSHRGQLKKYVGRSGYRLIYAWCSTCRKVNKHLEGSCPFCEEIPDDSVVFYNLYRKTDAHNRAHP
jgi:mRNA-degrading endonuclease RelE of RelBE toxin-antitoxin system